MATLPRELYAMGALVVFAGIVGLVSTWVTSEPFTFVLWGWRTAIAVGILYALTCVYWLAKKAVE